MSVPVYLRLADLARSAGCHPYQVVRAWHAGKIREVAYAGEAPLFDDTAIDPLRRYIQGIDEAHRRAGRKMSERRGIPGPTFWATSPDGRRFTGQSPAKFAAEHGLERSDVYGVLAGRQKTCRGGWRFEYAPIAAPIACGVDSGKEVGR